MYRRIQVPACGSPHAPVPLMVPWPAMRQHGSPARELAAPPGAS